LLQNPHIRITKAIEQDIDFIKQHIQLLDLDNRDLQFQQFVVAKLQDDIVGFGRIRKHKGCDEFCSLGIIEAYRNQGIAEALILAHIELSTQPIYLVCIIPEFFEPLGFTIVTEYPPEILDKLNYCISELTVPEPYVVMTLKQMWQY
jgi:N-acetylglutamate synthase-like GNAT family acetyltransferase